MSKWNDLNIKLRSIILSDSLRLEQTSSHIIKVLLRILKDKTKTLSNKSTSLSFKNKIDLLHDLDELSNDEHKHLVKFMEIRNQFMHNHEYNSFLKLKELNSELTNHLKNQFPNEEKDEEKSLFESYKKLYLTCQGKLLVLEMEYVAGMKRDYEQYISLEIDKRFDELVARAKLSTEKANSRLPFHPFFFQNPDSYIDSFILAFKLEKLNMGSEILEFIDKEDNIKLAFKRKISIEEQMNEIDDDSPE